MRICQRESTRFNNYSIYYITHVCGLCLFRSKKRLQPSSFQSASSSSPLFPSKGSTTTTTGGGSGYYGKGASVDPREHYPIKRGLVSSTKK